jgi:hypothetical protein
VISHKRTSGSRHLWANFRFTRQNAHDPKANLALPPPRTPSAFYLMARLLSWKKLSYKPNTKMAPRHGGPLFGDSSLTFGVVGNPDPTRPTVIRSAALP